MNIPENLLYTKDHEWLKVHSDYMDIGITDYAQSELGDIVFVEFPNVGDIFNKGDVFGTIEAVKTVADLYMPVSGKVIGINSNLESAPENVNTDPYANGWIIRVEMLNKEELSKLLSSKEYGDLI